MNTEMSEQELNKLNAWIAEHVMGWKCKHCVNGIKKKYTKFEYAQIRKEFPHWPSVEPDIDCYHYCNYSADPAAAMQVLEKCAESGVLNGEFKLPVSIFQRGDKQWVVSQNTEGDQMASIDCIVVEAPTLPLAIAKFSKELFSKRTP